MRTQRGHNNAHEAFARENGDKRTPPSRQQRSRIKTRQLPDCDDDEEVCISMSGTRVSGRYTTL